MFMRIQNNQGRCSKTVTRVSKNHRRHPQDDGSPLFEDASLSSLFQYTLIVTRENGSCGKIRGFKSGSSDSLQTRRAKPGGWLVSSVFLCHS